MVSSTNTLTPVLGKIEHLPLGAIPAQLSARVVRRIVDNESLASRLDVAAFNSAT